MNIPLNIDWQQILLHLFNFAILFAILYFLLYKPVKDFMAKREEYYKNMDAEEYRDKIKVLRGYGLGLPKLKVVNLYEEYIAWLIQYGKKPRTAINIGGNKFKLRKDMTDLEAYEISLGQRFNRSEIRDVLNEYYGQPIEKVPMAYRYEVAELRSYGVVGQSKEMLLQKRMKAAVSRQVKKNQETREELQAELSKDEVKK